MTRLRILVAGSFSLFTEREELYWSDVITKGIRELGFDVDLFMLPVVQNPLLLPEQMLALRFLDTVNSCDILLTVGYPAFVLKHPRKRVLLFSLAQNLDGWFDTEYGVLSTPQYNSIRNAVRTAEKSCLMEAERILCTSQMLATHLRSQYNLNSKAILFSDENFGETGEKIRSDGVPWIVCETTLEPSNRVDVLLDAITYSKENWNLLILVPSASDVYRQALLQRIQRMGIKDRVFITEGSLTKDILYGSCALINLDYFTARIPKSILNAVKFHAPIIISSDGGALLEVITAEVNGLIVNPSAKSIAQVIDRIVSDDNLRRELTIGNKNLDTGIVDLDRLLQELVG